MRVRQAVVPVAVDLAAGSAFALAWGIRWQGCAPPSVLCQLPGVVCAAACFDPWAQWPMTFLWGLLLGLVPSLMTFVTALLAGAPRASPVLARRLLLALSGGSVLLAVAGMDLMFLSSRGFSGDLVPWAFLVVAAALFVRSLFLVHAGAGPRSR